MDNTLKPSAVKVFTADKDFVPIRNAFFDHLLPTLPGNAAKIVLQLIRHTDGWGRESISLSFPKLRAATGIKSDHTLVRVLKKLCERQIVLRTMGRPWEAATYRVNHDFEVEGQAVNLGPYVQSKNGRKKPAPASEPMLAVQDRTPKPIDKSDPNYIEWAKRNRRKK